MKFLKLQLLIVALITFIASSAFAALSYTVSVDTTSLSGTDGYLYFQYLPVSGADSVATVSSFTTNGQIAPDPSANVVDGSAVSGQLPGSVAFANTNGVNDYNHAIHFGNTVSFLLSLSDPAPGGQAGGSSTFSLGLFSDEGGLAPLVTGSGTLFTVSLLNDGSSTTQIMANEATVTPTPIPAAAWLLGSGLMGLAGIRRRNGK